MGFLSNPPLGFADAVSMLNALPQGLLAEMVSIRISTGVCLVRLVTMYPFLVSGCFCISSVQRRLLAGQEL